MLLTVLILLPLLGAIATAIYSFAPSKQEAHFKWIALFFTLVIFAVSLALLRGVGYGDAEFHFVQNVQWIQAIKARYHIGVDGISLWLVILTTLLMPIAILCSWTAVKEKQAAYYAMLLFLESAMIGVFVSLDLLLFYLFFEASLVPMLFLIGVWGSKNRIYAATKFFIYTAVGSLLMLVGIIALYAKFGTWDYTELLKVVNQLPLNMEYWLFGAFALAFFIKVPMFPFHTWLPEAHTEAPTAGSVILAGVLLKMGTYGLLRFNLPLFPNASKYFAPAVIVLCIIGIIYGALVAMVQPDMKRLVAYSSVSHMGFVVLGLFSFTEQGMQGALYQMLNHGVSTGALFLFVGMIYERRHTRLIGQFGGLCHRMPVFSTLLVMASMASIGLPLLNGFVGEFLILLGIRGSSAVTHPGLATALAGLGVILSAVYMLWMLQRVIFGAITHEENAQLQDLNKREIGLVLPLMVLMLLMGLIPNVFLNKTRAAVMAAGAGVVQQKQLPQGAVAEQQPPHKSF
jgi:NADH-quinone oxidoreductase subunit M